MGIMVQDLYHQQKANSKSVEVIQLSQQTALQEVAAIAVAAAGVGPRLHEDHSWIHVRYGVGF